MAKRLTYREKRYAEQRAVNILHNKAKVYDEAMERFATQLSECRPVKLDNHQLALLIANGTATLKKDTLSINRNAPIKKFFDFHGNEVSGGDPDKVAELELKFNACRKMRGYLLNEKRTEVEDQINLGDCEAALKVLKDLESIQIEIPE